MFTQQLYQKLIPYRNIFESLPKGERAPEFTRADEKIIEAIDNQWRGTNEMVINCDECVEEAFERLMNEFKEYEKRN